MDDTDVVHIVSYDAVNLQIVYFNNISGSFEQYYFPAENYGYGTFNSITMDQGAGPAPLLTIATHSENLGGIMNKCP